MGITGTNLFILRKTFGPSVRVPNRLLPTATSHIKRCITAGLVTIDGDELVLTDAGVEALIVGTS